MEALLVGWKPGGFKYQRVGLLQEHGLVRVFWGHFL